LPVGSATTTVQWCYSPAAEEWIVAVPSDVAISSNENVDLLVTLYTKVLNSQGFAVDRYPMTLVY